MANASPCIPTKPGYYWFKGGHRAPWQLVVVEQDSCGRDLLLGHCHPSFGVMRRYPLHEIPYAKGLKYVGPILPPL